MAFSKRSEVNRDLPQAALAIWNFKKINLTQTTSTPRPLPVPTHQTTSPQQHFFILTTTTLLPVPDHHHTLFISGWVGVVRNNTS
jgi:hypothetical protein